MSRIAPLVDNLIGSEDADELLIDIMGALGDSVTSIPEVGKIYVFAYQPSTPNIRYDQNPLVAVTSVFDWGSKESTFIGVNLVNIPFKKWQVNSIKSQMKSYKT